MHTPADAGSDPGASADAGAAASGMTTHAEGITLQGLEKSFAIPQGVVRAVDGVDVEIARGETVALLGPNGAGKTTTIDMLLGLLPPDGGAVSLFGRPPSDAIAHGGVGAMLQTGRSSHHRP